MSESKRYFYELGKIFYKIDGFYADYARKSGVKENLLWVLYALNDGNEHSQKEISDSWDIPRTTVNTIVKQLITDGMVVLKQIPGEKRELDVILTEDGKLYANKLLAKVYEMEKAAYEKIADLDINGKLQALLRALNDQTK